MHSRKFTKVTIWINEYERRGSSQITQKYFTENKVKSQSKQWKIHVIEIADWISRTDNMPVRCDRKHEKKAWVIKDDWEIKTREAREEDNKKVRECFVEKQELLCADELNWERDQYRGAGPAEQKIFQIEESSRLKHLLNILIEKWSYFLLLSGIMILWCWNKSIKFGKNSCAAKLIGEQRFYLRYHSALHCFLCFC